MKILHLISSCGMFGAERVLVNIAKNPSSEFEYAVCAVNNIHNPHLEILDVARSMQIPVFSIDSRGKFDLSTIFALRNLIKKHNFSIINSHNYKSDVLAFFATRMTKCKWVATNHNWLSSDDKVKMFEALDTFCMRFADALVAVSEGVKVEMVELGLSNKKIEIVDNGIDIEKFNVLKDKSCKNQLGIPEHNQVVTVVGRLCADKAYDVFLEAANIVLKERRDVTFLVVGDGELRHSLENIAREFHIEKDVIFTGIRKDMPQIYSITDVFVVCSRFEGLPMCLLEAMAAKCAIVATPIGAIPNLIHDRISGRVVGVGEVKVLAKIIFDMLSDEKTRSELADAAYKIVVDGYSDKKMTKNYEVIYMALNHVGFRVKPAPRKGQG
ncbi:MAG: glycosyltransferase [Candidatus Omnitrophica bacterium]|nr:glycosyltransferase [Candidatus Omnitrophota bacterium]